MTRSRVLLIGFVLALGCGACSTAPPVPQSVLPTTTVLQPSTRVAPTRSLPLTLSSKTIRVGQPVTISGADCPAGHWGSATIDQAHSPEKPAIFAPGGFGLYGLESTFIAKDAVAGDTADAAGHWSLTAPVPMVAPGPAEITAFYAPVRGDEPAQYDFNYRPVAVMITSPFALVVRPGISVAPGATLSVTPVGGGCGIPAYAYVALYETSPSVTVLTQGTSTPGGAEWADTLTVPTSLAPGRYRLEADCVYSRGAVYGSYPAVTLTVT